MASYKEKLRERILQSAHEKGVCDERDIYFFASADRLPRGEYGICFVGLKESELFLCDTDMHSNLGETLYTIPLPKTEAFHVSRSLFGVTVRFSYLHTRYRLTNIAGLTKPMEQIILEEVNKEVIA